MPTEEERLYTLKVLKNSFEMYERTKEETKKVRKAKKDVYSEGSLNKTLELMETMQDDVKRKYIELGGNEEDLYKKDKPKKYERDKELLLALNREKNAENEQKKVPDELLEMPSQPKQEDVLLAEVQNEVKQTKKTDSKYYDTVKLPSKGECYPNKMKELSVSYLTAYDENLILSPSLYANGTFIDHILRNKIISDINPDNLIQGDRDAIIIWLRANGYGNEYPISVTDPETGKNFETKVDLSQLKFKKFTLKGDENGYFDYTLPKSGDVVKFRFLTNGDAKKIKELHDREEDEKRTGELIETARAFRDIIEDSEILDGEDADKALECINFLEEKVLAEYKKHPAADFNHDITNRLILSTVSINGNFDRKYIVDYILNMNIKDSIDYRTYIVDNEPGIDYNIKVKRPDSLGGGYIDTFLRLDQFIFVYSV